MVREQLQIERAGKSNQKGDIGGQICSWWKRVSQTEGKGIVSLWQLCFNVHGAARRPVWLEARESRPGRPFLGKGGGNITHMFLPTKFLHLVWGPIQVSRQRFWIKICQKRKKRQSLALDGDRMLRFLYSSSGAIWVSNWEGSLASLSEVPWEV